MGQRQRLIVGNWKMHKTVSEATGFVERLADLLQREITSPPPVRLELVLAPPFTALSAVADQLARLGLFVGAGGGAGRAPGSAGGGPPPVSLAAQDVHWEDQGAFTGEVSAPMLQDLGCRYVIIGHSERRRHFGETDATVGKKVAAALRRRLRPILCIGETWEQRQGGQTEHVLSAQLTESLSAVEKEQASDVVIAYEPVWAIGSGHPATSEQARKAHRHVRTRIMALWGQDAGENAPILYGGSVTPDNIEELLATPDIDGALVGGACLDPVQFAKILVVACIRP
jgi:triosephosphate isomerase